MQLKQDYAKGHSRMATALMAMKMFREAQQSYRTALRIEPGNEAVVNQLLAVENKIAAAEKRENAPGRASALPAPAPDGASTVHAALSSSGLPRQVAAVMPPALAHVEGRIASAAGSKRDGSRLGLDDGSGKRQAICVAEGTQAQPKTRLEELQQAGNVAFRAGEHARAFLLFSEAIDTASPPNANLHANRSAVLCALMRFEEAIEDADKAVHIKPDWSRGHSRRGNALHAMCKRGNDRWEEARQAYLTALEIDPEVECIRHLKGS